MPVLTSKLIDNSPYSQYAASQSIKNPLAKSAKAARLLKAEHRIVLTKQHL